MVLIFLERASKPPQEGSAQVSYFNHLCAHRAIAPKLRSYVVAKANGPGAFTGIGALIASKINGGGGHL